MHERAHSVKMTLEWRDQGWGNQKGAIWVVGCKKDDVSRVTEFESVHNRVVYQSDLAPHATAKLEFSWVPRPDEAYHVWYRVGGGGGHTLLLRGVVLCPFVYDDNQQSIQKVYQALRKANMLESKRKVPCLCIDMLRHNVQSLRDTLNAGKSLVGNGIASILESHGIACTMTDLVALDVILCAIEEWEAVKKMEEADDVHRVARQRSRRRTRHAGL
jgi:hypothetical protein